MALAFVLALTLARVCFGVEYALTPNGRIVARIQRKDFMLSLMQYCFNLIGVGVEGRKE
jgi:hypothetical protein